MFDKVKGRPKKKMVVAQPLWEIVPVLSRIYIHCLPNLSLNFGLMKRLMFLVGLVILGCEDYDDCGVSNLSEELHLQFHDMDTKKTKKVIFDAMTVQFTDGGVINYQDTIGATGYVFPVSLADTLTHYSFVTDTAVYNFELWYDLEAIVENPECGPIFRVKQLNYNRETLTFDSAAIKVLELTTLISPHVEVYF